MDKKSPVDPKRTRIKILKKDTEEEIDEKKFRQETVDMKFKEKWNCYEKEKGIFLEEWVKTHALIYGNFCPTEMRTTVKEHPEFEAKIRDEPLELLRAISVLMYTPVRARYPFSTLAETLSSLFNLRQIQDEKLVDYIERFT